MTGISCMRNIGISAHIDSGKTTLTERILFYCEKIHAIHEVRGKDGVGATMDSMELEKERGITIASAATNVIWKNHAINIIDTPGHVDFTIEVERALRVLDGAVLVLCSVGGVQSQSITVDRQLKRYGIPRIAFINKCDRTGANPYRVCQQLREKLDLNAVMMSIPIGLEDRLEGVVDLISMKALYFPDDGTHQMQSRPIPETLLQEAKEKREEMLDALSMFSDELMETLMEGLEPSEEMINQAARTGTLKQELVPVYPGSAYRNKGVQPLLDAVIHYLPHPADIENHALDLNEEEREVLLTSDPTAPTVALAFKLEESQYGQLTYVRIYQGSLKKGGDIFNVRNKRKVKVGRLIRMHADNMEEITEAGPGDIVALFGIECTSGDTFVTPGIALTMTSMYVPRPVISLSVNPKDKAASDKMSKALGRFTKEDPTFHCFVDPESNQTIIQGMGELHLEVYIERMKREYGAAVETGRPQVAYRETISRPAPFDYTHKKQTGGAGQFGRVAGLMEPLAEGDYEFSDQIKGGVIPNEFIPSCDKGFRESLKKGTMIGFPIVGIKMTINDGQYHPVDSSDMAFQAAARGAFKTAYGKANPIILEPIMRLSVEAPTEFQGNIFGSINQRRGIITTSSDEGSGCVVEAEIPLSEMFGYSTVLRSLTQGKGEFTMEFLKYGKVPVGIAEKLKDEFKEKEK